MSRKDERITEEAAATILRGLFRLQPEATGLTPFEIYEAANRPAEHDRANRVWLSNRLTHLKHHGFVRPVYGSEGGSRRLEQVELTFRGRRALKKLSETESIQEEEAADQPRKREYMSRAMDNSIQKEVAIDEVVSLIEKWAEYHPAYRVHFTFSLEYVGKE